MYTGSLKAVADAWAQIELMPRIWPGLVGACPKPRYICYFKGNLVCSRHKVGTVTANRHTGRYDSGSGAVGGG